MFLHLSAYFRQKNAWRQMEWHTDTTLAILAKRMGNTVKVAEMYSEWVDEYSDPLWA